MFIDEKDFLLTYITTSGKTYTEFKTFENGIDKDKCVRRILDEFDELPYLYLEKEIASIISMLITLKV